MKPYFRSLSNPILPLLPAFAAGFCAPVILFTIFLFFLPAARANAAFFRYKNVVRQAAELAKKTYQAPPPIPRALSALRYNQWRSICFKPEKSLWRRRKLSFEVQLFHPGFLYNRVVAINVVRYGHVRAVPFSREMFNYGIAGLKAETPKGLGFAGFRIHYPINIKKYKDEFAVFLGASYFRATGAGENYGLSARGLAIDCALPAGEEFPWFREFWLVRPVRGARSITVYALMDSPSVAGAYKFMIRPGETTVMTVNCALFPRKKIKKPGIAPLTSMFFYGENTNVRPVDDFRPQVHDSDGLLIETGTGEWIWRPLINPARLLVTSFQMADPKGFGLFQQDRNFNDYQDLESHYEKRPSLWVKPLKGFSGKGRVELVEIPAPDEHDDNIVAYWVPDHIPKSFSYRLEWGPVDSWLPPGGKVIATRTAAGRKSGDKLYLIDFNGARLRHLPARAGARLKGVVTMEGAALTGEQLEKNTATGGWRLIIHARREKGMLGQVISKVAPDGFSRPIELRAFLRLGKNTLTDTWSYVDPQ